MSKDAQNNEALGLQPNVQEKLGELIALLAAYGGGEQGPPQDATFAQI